MKTETLDKANDRFIDKKRPAKRIVFGFIASGILFLFSSCCTLRDCGGFDETRMIELVNYVITGSDTVTVETFATNSSFNSRIDSTYNVAYLGLSGAHQEVALYLSDRIYSDRDYRITFLSTGQVFDLTHIRTTKQSCNSCPIKGSEDLYEILESYRVNGVEQYDNSLKIWM